MSALSDSKSTQIPKHLLQHTCRPNTNNFYPYSFKYSYLIIICLHTVIWFQVFLSNTNNLLAIIWFQVTNNNP